MRTAGNKIKQGFGWVCAWVCLSAVVCLNGCGESLLDSTLESSVTSTSPSTERADPPPAEPGSPSPGSTDPTTPTKPTTEIGHFNGPDTATDEAPLEETHSIRSEDANHRSDEFQATPPPADSRPPHEILDETLRQAMAESGMNLNLQDIEKVVEMVLIRIKHDPAVRNALQRLSEDPGNSTLQQKVLDLFLEVEDEKVREFLKTAFNNIEYFYQTYYPPLRDAWQDAQAWAPQAKTLLDQSKDLYPKIKDTVHTGMEYAQWGFRLGAYTGAAMSIFLGNELFLGVCRAKPKTRFRTDPLQFGREAARHYALWWFAGLALESYFVLKAVNNLEMVESVKGYLGTGALMGAFILAQCEGVRALRNRRTTPPVCGGKG